MASKFGRYSIENLARGKTDKPLKCVHLKTPGELATLGHVQMTMLSGDDIRNIAVCQITTHEDHLKTLSEPISGSIYDPKLGPYTKNKECITCGGNLTTCPGHWGFYELPVPLYHTMALPELLKFLRCTCYRCGNLIFDMDSHNVQEAMRAPAKARLNRFSLLRQPSASMACMNVYMGAQCGYVQPFFTMQSTHLGLNIRLDPEGGDDDMKDDYEQEGVYKALSAADALKHLNRITPVACNALGFRNVHDIKACILECLPIPPVCVRPLTPKQDGHGGWLHDDLSTFLKSIIKMGEKLRHAIENGAAPVAVTLGTLELQQQVARYFDNSPTSSTAYKPYQLSGRQLNSLKWRFNGKEGRIRGNLMGKRVDFTARTVITPDPYLPLDGLGVPRTIAMEVSKKERVSHLNVEKLRQTVANGPFVDGGAISVVSGGVEHDLRAGKFLPSHLRIGDDVNRHLQDGDIVLFNRQPSLHKMSMMGHRVKIMNYSTFRLNLSVTTPYNADFDGDEMNMHVPQDLLATSECDELIAVPKQIISAAKGMPIMGLVQDTLLAAYKITHPAVLIDRALFFDMAMCTGELSRIPPPTVLKPQKYWTGKQAFSLFLPKISVTRCGAEIVDGHLRNGRMDKKLLGQSRDSLITLFWKELGPEETAKFMSAAQLVLNHWMLHQGHTIGIQDCVFGADFQREVDQAVGKAFVKAQEVIDSARRGEQAHMPGLTYEGAFEANINKELNAARDTAANACMSRLTENNGIYTVVTAGSKGSSLNIAQISALVGQQNLGGKRMPNGFHDRTLPHFCKHDVGPVPRGFVASSFIGGLSPTEFWFHAVGGREGCVDTAVKTATTGYTQRQVIKCMEEMCVAYDCTVRGPGGSIIQFMYGDDGIDGQSREFQKVDLLLMSDAQIDHNFLVCEADIDTLPVNRDARRRLMSDAEEFRVTAKNAAQLKRIRDLLRLQLLKDNKNIMEEAVRPLSVNIQRVIHEAHAKFGQCSAEEPSDLTPGRVVSMIEATGNNIAKDLNRMNLVPECLTWFFALMHGLLGGKRAIRDHCLSELSLSWILRQIETRFAQSMVQPGEMVGVLAGQSIGEPLTQMTLNSVRWDTGLVFIENGKSRSVQIGEWIDGLMSENVDRVQIFERGSEYLELATPITVPDVEENGKVCWQRVEAVTRHPVVNRDSSTNLLKVTTRCGRTVFATKGKSFLTRCDNKIVQVEGEDLRVGDYLPVIKNLPVPPAHVGNETVNILPYLPNEGVLTTNPVVAAVAACPANFDSLNKRKKGEWWKKVSPSLPTYSRSDSFWVALRRNPRLLEPGLVFPLTGHSGAAPLLQNLPLDLETGFMFGIYAADGCTRGSHQVVISKNDECLRRRVEKWADARGMQHKTVVRNVNNGVSTCISIYSTTLSWLMERVCGIGAFNKKLPEFVFSAPDDFVRGVVAGVLAGDGTVSTTRPVVSISSRSLRLLTDLSLALARFGVNSKLMNYEQTEYGGLVHTLTIRNRNIVRLDRMLGPRALTIPHKIENLRILVDEHTFSYDHLGYATIPGCTFPSVGKRNEAMLISELRNVLGQMSVEDRSIAESVLDCDMTFSEIISIEEVPALAEHPLVYDLTVENTRNFILANGIACADTFHNAGVSAKNVTLGLPRINEIIHCSKNLSCPWMHVAATKDLRRDRLKMQALARNLVVTNFKDLVDHIHIACEKDMRNSIFEEDRDWFEAFWLLEEDNLPMEQLVPVVLRISLDRVKLAEAGMTAGSVVHRLRSEMSCFEVPKNGRTGEAEPQNGFYFIAYTEEAAGEQVIRIQEFYDTRIEDAKEMAFAFGYKTAERLWNALCKVVLKGVPGISKAFIEEVTGKYKVGRGHELVRDENHFAIVTEGTNLAGVLQVEGVDIAKTRTNDIMETFHVLGIEAARQLIVDELKASIGFDGTYVDVRHEALLADAITNSGTCVPSSRHGMARGKMGPLSRCTFEQSTATLFDAAVHRECDKLDGVSNRVIMGMQFPGGTSCFNLLLDAYAIKNADPVKKELTATTSVLDSSFLDALMATSGPLQQGDYIPAGAMFNDDGPNMGVTEIMEYKTTAPRREHVATDYSPTSPSYLNAPARSMNPTSPSLFANYSPTSPRGYGSEHAAPDYSPTSPRRNPPPGISKDLYSPTSPRNVVEQPDQQRGIRDGRKTGRDGKYVLYRTGDVTVAGNVNYDMEIMSPATSLTSPSYRAPQVAGFTNMTSPMSPLFASRMKEQGMSPKNSSVMFQDGVYSPSRFLSPEGRRRAVISSPRDNPTSPEFIYAEHPATPKRPYSPTSPESVIQTAAKKRHTQQ